MKQPKEQINGRVPLGEISKDLGDFDKTLESGNARVAGIFGTPTRIIEEVAKAAKRYKEKEETNGSTKEN